MLFLWQTKKETLRKKNNSIIEQMQHYFSILTQEIYTIIQKFGVQIYYYLNLTWMH